MKQESKEGLVALIGASVFGVACRYSLESALYYYPKMMQGNNNLETCGDFAGAFFITLVSGTLAGVLGYYGAKKIYKSIKKKE